MRKKDPIISAGKWLKRKVDEVNMKEKDPKVKCVACFVLKFKGARCEFRDVDEVIAHIKKHKIQQSVLYSVCRRMKKTPKGKWVKSWEETIDYIMIMYDGSIKKRGG